MAPSTSRPAPLHQTVRHSQYDLKWRQLADDLFNRVRQRVGMGRSRSQPAGSYSIQQTNGKERAAKIVIFEAKLQKKGMTWAPSADGVYVCLRTDGNVPSLPQTVAFLPHPTERFAFFRLDPNQDLDGMADFIAACSDY